jgi:DNA-directed RNA polymerase subunit H (RpoH/RPB5)
VRIEHFLVDELRHILNQELWRYVIVGKPVTKDDGKLPALRLNGPAARVMGFGVGDIIRITRPNGEVYFRLVRDV